MLWQVAAMESIMLVVMAIQVARRRARGHRGLDELRMNCCAIASTRRSRGRLQRQRPLPSVGGALILTHLPAALPGVQLPQAYDSRCRAAGLLTGATWAELDQEQDGDGRHQQPGGEQDVNGEAEDG